MLIHSVIISNYRPFKVLQETKLGQMATIVGKNDAGKSSILHGIELFFEKIDLESDDIHDTAIAEEPVIVEIAFKNLPTVFQIEKGVDTTLKEEMLLDQKGNLRVHKELGRNGKVSKLSLITNNFVDPFYSDLPTLSETELNKKLAEKGEKVEKSGRGITNKEKREKLRNLAIAAKIELGKVELALNLKDDLWKNIEVLFPTFSLFESDHNIDVGDTWFQKEFRPIIDAAAKDPAVEQSKAVFTGAIGRAVQTEMDKICAKLKTHTDAVTCLTVKPEFAWDKAVTLEVYGRDQHGIDKPLEKRGTGLRRLLMVAFFEHLVEKKIKGSTDIVFGIEEPENGLHPGLQRELAKSFQTLTKQGYQVIVTTHSPVLAGASPIEDLVLISRNEGVAQATQVPLLNLETVANELGVEPSDQIMGYNACLFVEGEDDIFFWDQVSQKLKDAGIIPSSFVDKKIGLIMYGGDNLKHWINMGAMKKISKKFIVIKDSDRKRAEDRLPERFEKWKEKCVAEGGDFYCLKKREIENYLHIDAIAASGRPIVPFDDYSDMKSLFGENVIKVLKNMTAPQLLEKDAYSDGTATQRHELKEIAQKMLALT